jgi:hypothetical protein
MRPMVGDAELSGDDARHPCARPELAAKAICFCAMREQLWNLQPLLISQPGGCAQVWVCTQCFSASFTHGIYPLADGSLGDAKGFSNRLLLPAVVLEGKGLPSS